MPMWKPRLTGKKGPLFRELVQALADDIAAGRLAPGTKLPPHRDLADALVVARGTVARAYREAEKVGLVRSDVGRGTYVLSDDGGHRPYASLLETPTAISDLSTSLPLSGIDPDPGAALAILAQRPNRHALFRYHAPSGTRRHRQAGVQWLERLDVHAELDDVLLCAGAQHGIFVVLASLASRGRALYVEELTYPGMHGVAEMLGLALVPVALDDEGMVADDLARLTKRHGPGTVYVMPTIHNPTGAVMSAERRQALAVVARDRGLFVLEDAANRMLASRRPPPLRAYAPERTFVVASVSKVLLPGLRVAYLTGPRAELGAITRRLWASHWMVSAVGPEIVTLWLEDGTVDETARRKRDEARRRQAIARAIFDEACVKSHPEALHAWLTYPRRHDVRRSERIVVTPASAFWTRTTPPPSAVRVALGGVDRRVALRTALTELAASWVV